MMLTIPQAVSVMCAEVLALLSLLVLLLYSLCFSLFLCGELVCDTVLICVTYLLFSVGTLLSNCQYHP